MKSKMMKKIIALVLCMALVLGCGTYALADEAASMTGTVSQEAQDISVETVEEETTQDVVVDSENATKYEVSDSETTYLDGDSEETTTVEEQIVESDTEVTDAETVDTEESVVSEDDAVAEPTVELTTEADGTTILLTGPASSFESGKEYTIEATKVENTETIETIEAALAEMEDEETVVNNYQAFDIKLYADGVEAQPLGPVEVRFSGNDVAESVSNADTETTVIHVDETTGKSQDMNAVATSDNDVTIETTHFSIYIIVDTGRATDHITVTIEHYGTIQTIAPWKTSSGAASAVYVSGATKSTDPFTIDANKNTVDAVYNTSSHTINTVQYTGQLYTTDTNVNIPNLYEASIDELSKVCEATDKVDPNYEIEKVVVTVDGTATTYYASSNPTITLRKNATIRFYYKERTTSTIWQEPVVFYDYNVSSTGNWFAEGDGAGTNSNLDSSLSATKKLMAVGQWVSGNQADWNWDGCRNNPATSDDAPKVSYSNDRIAKTYLVNSDSNVSVYGDSVAIGPNIGTLNICGGYGNNETMTDVTESSNTYKYRKLTYLTKAYDYRNWYNIGVEIKKGLTKSTISKDSTGSYKLAYNNGLQQPGFFESGKYGTLVLDDYTLGFKQTGNTYVMSKVYRNGTQVNTSTTVGGNTDYSVIQEYNVPKVGNESEYDTNYSNNFWPLDTVTQADYDAAGVTYKMDKRPTLDEIAAETGSKRKNDDGTSANHNWHFGMRYEFKFTIGDYTGPMNYYFRGDDDFWLYIDGKKAVEIGGIHSAAGQALDVRQWLKENYSTHLNDPNYEYTVSVFYMERGGYGSSCYMQYTLPNCVEVDIPAVNSTEVTVDKAWLADDSVIQAVDVVLYQKSSSGTEKEYGTATLSDSNSWTYTWKNLPLTNPNKTTESYTYRVVEKSSSIPTGVTTSSVTSGSTTTITNTQKITIPVEKIWDDSIEGTDDYAKLRPESVQVKLLADGKQVGDTITLKASNSWKGSWSNLPKYKFVNGVKTLIVYSVEEVVPSGSNLEKYYTVGYDNNYGTNSFDGTFTVTNTLVTEKIQITKTGSADGSVLAGATFKLTSTSNTKFPATSKTTGEDGIITFEVPYGTYVLTETKAPDGFALLGDHFTIEVSDAGVGYWVGDKGTEAQKIALGKDEEIYVWTISNAPIYELPSTGGPGIYGGMLGGFACLLAGVFTMHRRRCRAILRKR